MTDDRLNPQREGEAAEPWRPSSLPLCGPPPAPIAAEAPVPPDAAPPLIVRAARHGPTLPRRRAGLIVLTVLATVALVLAAGTASIMSGLVGLGTSGASAHSTYRARGVLELKDAAGVLNLDGATCSGMRGYDDIHAGAQVVVTDQSGTVIATGSLEAGQLLGSGADRVCRFQFQLPVPTGKSFYGVTVSHRGTIQYTESALRAGVHLSLG
jgi:hypothetical protein